MGRPSLRSKGSYGQHLAALREAAGFTQKHLASLVGVHQSNIAFWECWNKPPRGEILIKLAEALGVSLEVLLDAKNPAQRRPLPKVGCNRCSKQLRTFLVASNEKL